VAAYRRVYDSRHIQADCEEPGSAPEPYARQSSMGYLYLLPTDLLLLWPVRCDIGNESVPIQLAQCRFPGLAISNAKILIYVFKKMYGSNFIRQHSETVTV